MEKITRKYNSRYIKIQMRSIVLQDRRKVKGCEWKDYMGFGGPDEAAALAFAGKELMRRLPGGACEDTYYNNKRDWRIVIRETTERVIA